MIAEFTLDDGKAVTINMGQIDHIQPSDEGTLVVTEATSCRQHQEPTSPSFAPPSSCQRKLASRQSSKPGGMVLIRGRLERWREIYINRPIRDHLPLAPRPLL